MTPTESKIDAYLFVDPDSADDLRRRLDLANRRVVELREQVQKQIDLRVAAEQRAGNRNVEALEQPLWFVSNGFQRGGCIGTVVRAKDGAAAILRAREAKLFGPNDGSDKHLTAELFVLGTVIDLA